MTTPEDEQEPKNSLSHKILNTHPETPGCSAAPVFAFLGFGGSLYLGLPFWASLLVTGSGIVCGYILTMTTWWAFQRLFQSTYAALPGRMRRDAKRLAVWAEQHNCRLVVDNDLEISNTPDNSHGADGARGADRAGGFIRLQALPDGHHVLPSSHLEAHQVEGERLVSSAWSLFLDVAPRPGGYVLRVCFHMPKPWRELLQPCVAKEPRALGDWISCLPLGDEEGAQVRPFVWRLLIDRKDDEPVFSEDDARRYVHSRELYEWAFDTAYWSGEAVLAICKEIPLASLEEKLTFYKRQGCRLRGTLERSQEPLLDQLVQELSVLSWPVRLPYLRAHQQSMRGLLERERKALMLHFWCLLCQEEGEATEVKEAFSQLLGSASATLTPELIEAIDPVVCDGFVVPMLQHFVMGGWRDVLATQPRRILGREGGYRRFVEPYGAYDMAGESSEVSMAFGVCLDVLAELLPQEKLLAICKSLAAPLPKEASPMTYEEGVCARQLRREALEQWHFQARGEMVPQLLQWLEEEDAAFQCEVLDAIAAFALHSEAIESAVMAQVAPYMPTVLHEQLIVRVSAIQALSVIGTEYTVIALGQAMEIFDPNSQQVAIDAADKALDKLYKSGIKRQQEKVVPVLQGALSTPEGVDEEGQLSLTEAERVEGQLSLSGAEEGQGTKGD